jgi:Kef-type K+ transport system membrane component KefB
VSTTVLFVGVVVFAFVAGRVLERFTAKAFALAGVEYLLLGVLLGPGLGVLGRDELQALDLFVSTVLGVLGFLVGLEIRQIRATTESLLAGLGATAAVVLGVAAAVTGLYQWLDPSLLHADPIVAEPLTAGEGWLVSLWVAPESLWIGLTVGAAAGTCSTVLVDTALRRFDVSPERAALLRTMTAMAQVLAVLVFGLAMVGSRATTTGAMGLTIIEWVAITILSGGFTGLLFSIFLGREDDPVRLSVAAVGVIVLAAGVGAALGVSPLFTNLFAGLTLALTSTHAARLEDSLRPLRFPTTVLVLLLAGAAWVPVSGFYWVLVPSYVLLRTLARLWFSRVAVSTFMGDEAAARGIGRGLLGQGVLASAISLAFAQRFPELAAPVTSTILGGVLLTDLFAQRSLRRYLADAGEIKALASVAAAPEPIEDDEDPAAAQPVLAEPPTVPLDIVGEPDAPPEPGSPAGSAPTEGT